MNPDTLMDGPHVDHELPPDLVRLVAHLALKLLVLMDDNVVVFESAFAVKRLRTLGTGIRLHFLMNHQHMLFQNTFVLRFVATKVANVSGVPWGDGSTCGIASYALFR